MKNDLIKAIDILNSGQYTCVLCRENIIYTSTERGVKPLLDWLDSGINLNGFSAADKVVGKAAAFLYILLGVKEVYAPVMSSDAIKLLIRNGILSECETKVNFIINRTGMGVCPIEQEVKNICDPHQALCAIKKRVITLSAENHDNYFKTQGIIQ